MNNQRGESVSVRTVRSTGIVLALGGALAGCPVPRPKYPIADGQTVQTILHNREAQSLSLRARGSVEHYGKDGRVRGSVTILVRRPNLLRVDTTAFGNLISSMVSDGVHHALLQERSYYVGDARPCIAKQLLGMALEGSEIVTVLTGGVPWITTDLPAPTWRDGRYVMIATATNGDREEVRFELPSADRELPAAEQHIRPSRVILSDRAGVRLDVTYESYRDVAGTAYPDRVRIQQPRENTDTIVRFEDIVPNFTIPEDPLLPGVPPPDPFEVHTPAGAEVIPLICEP